MTSNMQNHSWRSDAVRLASALIIAVGFAVGCYFIGGRYESISSDGDLVLVTDRLTGTVQECNGELCVDVVK